MDPIAALDRALYLLDRERAPRQKVQAFVKAKAAAVELGPEEIARHVGGCLVCEICYGLRFLPSSRYSYTQADIC